MDKVHVKNKVLDKVFCSYSHKMKHMGSLAKNQKSRTVTCKECGKPFVSKAPHAKFCSYPCRKSVTLEKCLSGLLGIKGYDRGDLSPEYMMEMYEYQKGRCAISNIPMTNIKGQGFVFTNISLDRITSKSGYTKENVHLVCYGVNRMKTDFEMEEFIETCRKVAENNPRPCTKQDSMLSNLNDLFNQLTSTHNFIEDSPYFHSEWTN